MEDQILVGVEYHICSSTGEKKLLILLLYDDCSSIGEKTHAHIASLRRSTMSHFAGDERCELIAIEDIFPMFGFLCGGVLLSRKRSDATISKNFCERAIGLGRRVTLSFRNFQ